MSDIPTYVLLPVSPNQGYAPDQVYEYGTPLTLGDLLAHIKDAVSLHGPDAIVIAHEDQTYGANYGALYPGGIEEYYPEDDDEDWDEEEEEDA